MGLEHAINIDDLRKLAKRRLPKIAYDFIEGGLEDERGIARNESAFAGFDLVPRYGIDVSACDQSTMLFGRTYAGPLGIAPTGIAGLFRPGADLMLAEAAKSANVPFIMSGTGTALIEDLGRIAPEHGWYQLYPARDRSISEDMIRRARDAGLSTLVITVDVPVNSKRERNLRNGFTRPLRMTMKTKLEALLHPGWMAEYLRTGMPLFSNWQKYAPAGATTAEVADFVATQTPVPVLWRDIEDFRRLVAGQARDQGHHARRRRDTLRRTRLRRHHGVEPRRPSARQVSSTGGGAAGHRRGRRRQADRDVRQRHPARVGCRGRAVPRGEVRVRRPGDALRRGSGRHHGGGARARHLQGRDRPHHDADGCARHPQPRAAIPDLGFRRPAQRPIGRASRAGHRLAAR